jgi:hypothetical protein
VHSPHKINYIPCYKSAAPPPVAGAPQSSHQGDSP